MPPAPVIVVIGGLPATGKTTISRSLARALSAAYVRIDTIEAAISRAEERHIDVAGLAGPSWAQIAGREYEPWDRDRVVADTARLRPEQAVAAILAETAR